MPFARPSRSPRSPILGLRLAESFPCAGAEWCPQRQPLALGHRADRLALVKADGRENPPAAHVAPLSLAQEHVSDRHALELPRVEQDHIGGAQMPVGDAPLELGAGLAYPVGAREGLVALPGLDVDRRRVHLASNCRVGGYIIRPTRATAIGNLRRTSVWWRRPAR